MSYPSRHIEDYVMKNHVLKKYLEKSENLIFYG
jgi:hypothetical protein